MKHRIGLVILVLALGTAMGSPVFAQSTDLARTRDEFLNPKSRFVLVSAHRACWKHAPENSLPAIDACIKMGVDIVEVDVRKTSDGHLVLMHDDTVDRTTDGKGRLADMTLAQVKQLRLKRRDGTVTDERVPTLEETARVAKGKIILNLDKSYAFIKEMDVLFDKAGMAGQALYKGTPVPDKVQSDLSGLDRKPLYIPVVRCTEEDGTTRKGDECTRWVAAFLNELSPPAMELILPQEDDPVLSPDVIALARKKGVRIWVNTLWDSLSGGHSDAQALEDPDANWGWCVQHGATILQTDEPEAMLKYLRKKGWHW